jgi:hypothetical protein
MMYVRYCRQGNIPTLSLSLLQLGMAGMSLDLQQKKTFSAQMVSAKMGRIEMTAKNLITAQEVAF